MPRATTIVAPKAADGGTDIIARALARIFAPELGGQTVVVDKRGGATGHLGPVRAARQGPGATPLPFVVSTKIVANPQL